jgi:hypothetical protein
MHPVVVARREVDDHELAAVVGRRARFVAEQLADAVERPLHAQRPAEIHRPAVDDRAVGGRDRHTGLAGDRTRAGAEAAREEVVERPEPAGGDLDLVHRHAVGTNVSGHETLNHGSRCRNRSELAEPSGQTLTGHDAEKIRDDADA